MSLASTVPRTVALGVGSTSIYGWGAWQVNQESDLHVAVLSNASPQVLTVLTLNTDYTFQNPAVQLDNSNGGNIVLSATGFLAPSGGNLPTGWGIVMRRVVTFGQPDELGNQGSFAPASIEDMFDYQAMQSLQLQDAIAHCVQLPLDDYAVAGQGIGLASARAGQFVGFDNAGNVISTAATLTGITASTFGAELVQTASKTTAATLIGSTLGAELMEAASATAALTDLGVTTFAQELLGGANAAAVLGDLGSFVPSGTNVAGPALGFSNIDHTVVNKLNVEIVPTSSDGNTYTYTWPYGEIYSGVLVQFWCTYTSVSTTPIIESVFDSGAPSQPNTIVNKSGGALSAGQLVAGTMYLLAYDGAYWRVMV